MFTSAASAELIRDAQLKDTSSIITLLLKLHCSTALPWLKRHAKKIIDMKISHNNLVFPSQISKVPMVEHICKVEVVSLDCAPQLKLPLYTILYFLT